MWSFSKTAKTQAVSHSTKEGRVLMPSGQPFIRSGKVITCKFVLGLEGNLYVLEWTDAWRLRCSWLSGELRVLVKMSLGCHCSLGWLGSGGAGRVPASGSRPPRDPIPVGVVCSVRGAEGGHRTGLLAATRSFHPRHPQGARTELRTEVAEAESSRRPCPLAT